MLIDNVYPLMYGYKLLVIWEHELKDIDKLNIKLQKYYKEKTWKQLIGDCSHYVLVFLHG